MSVLTLSSIAWRRALQDRELVMVGVIVGLVVCLLSVCTQAAYLMGIMDGARRAAAETPSNDGPLTRPE